MRVILLPFMGMAFYALALAILVSAYRIWKERDPEQEA